MNSFLIIISLFLLIFPPPPSSSIRHRRLMLLEEEMRLGSMPPSCHNKCNGCHPCMAVQVPSLLSPDGAQTGLGNSGSGRVQNVEPFGNRYSSYKPLGWKCRCGDDFYNP